MIDTSDERCAVVCMMVSNPVGGEQERRPGWKKDVNDLVRALRDERNDLKQKLAKHEPPDDGVRFHCAHCDWKTPRRNIVDLARHVNEKHPSETFLCGRRSPGLSDHVMEGMPDCWEKMPNGDKVCLHCGSLSEADLFDIIEHYLAGDEGYRFETTDKGYKVYAQRPGVINASNGGIKFYGHHADKTHPDFAKRTAMFERAVQVSNERFRAMIDRQRDQFKKPAAE